MSSDLHDEPRRAQLVKKVVIIGLMLLAATAVVLTWRDPDTPEAPPPITTSPLTVEAWAIPRPNYVQFLLPEQVLRANAPPANSRCSELFHWARQFDLTNLESMRLVVRFTSKHYVQLTPTAIRVSSIDDPLPSKNINEVGLVRCADSSVNFIDNQPLQDGFVDTGDGYPTVESVPFLYPHGSTPHTPRGTSLGGGVVDISPGEKFQLQVDVGLAAGAEPPTRFALEVDARVNGVLKTFILNTDGDGKPFEIYPYFGGIGGPKPDFYEWQIGTPGQMKHLPAP